MRQTFDIEVHRVDEAAIWTTRYYSTGIKMVCAEIPAHGFYRCPATTYARMIRRSRSELLDRIIDVHDGYHDSPPITQYLGWPKPLLAVMCGEWEGD